MTDYSYQYSAYSSGYTRYPPASTVPPRRLSDHSLASSHGSYASYPTEKCIRRSSWVSPSGKGVKAVEVVEVAKGYGPQSSFSTESWEHTSNASWNAGGVTSYGSQSTPSRIELACGVCEGPIRLSYYRCQSCVSYHVCEGCYPHAKDHHPHQFTYETSHSSVSTTQEKRFQWLDTESETSGRGSGRGSPPPRRQSPPLEAKTGRSSPTSIPSRGPANPFATASPNTSRPSSPPSTPRSRSPPNGRIRHNGQPMLEEQSIVVQDLMACIRDLHTQLDAKNEEITALKGSMGQQFRDKSVQDRDVRDYERELASLRVSHAQLQQSYTEVMTSRPSPCDGSCHKALSDFEARVLELQRELSRTKENAVIEAMQGKDAEVEALRETVRGLEARLRVQATRWQEQILSRDSEMLRLQRELNLARNHEDERIQELERKSEAQSKLFRSLEELTMEERSSMDEERARLAEQQANMQQELQSAQQEAASTRELLELLKKELQEKSSMIERRLQEQEQEQETRWQTRWDERGTQWNIEWEERESRWEDMWQVRESELKNETEVMRRDYLRRQEEWQHRLDRLEAGMQKAVDELQEEKRLRETTQMALQSVEQQLEHQTALYNQDKAHMSRMQTEHGEITRKYETSIRTYETKITEFHETLTKEKNTAVRAVERLDTLKAELYQACLAKENMMGALQQTLQRWEVL